MILVDANVFMYAAGAAHPKKKQSIAFFELAIESGLDIAVDAEVLQEILHRYRAIKRWDQGKQVYDLARKIVPTVIPIGADLLDSARLLLDEYPEALARDALHAAVCRLPEVDGICSFDTDFDRFDGVTRLTPGDFVGP
jgi:predicted nucleic acid-binding protein